MKKILIIASCISAIALAFVISSYSKSNKDLLYKNRISIVKSHKSTQLDDFWDVTLNGIKEDQAQAMKDQFQRYRGQDYRPIQESVWFDKTTIQRISDLLIAERGNFDGHYKMDQTDGVRIYFVSDLSVKTGHLKNSIILVSTKYDGASTSAPSGALHLDYYKHKKSDILFSDLNEIKGLTLPRQPINTRGENLYNIYFSIKDVQTCDEPHYIFRAKAYKMANQFGRNRFGKKDTINTTSEWFDLELFKSFADAQKSDGLRVYFTRHPARYKSKDDKDAYLDAFVLITTKKVKISKRIYHNDYFDCRTTHNYFQSYFAPSKWHKLRSFASGSGGDDNGELCQPNCQQ